MHEPAAPSGGQQNRWCGLQNDIHSPQTTVEEALTFSGSLRLGRWNSAAVIKSFVQEIMGIVELTPLAGALVGLPGAPPLTLSGPAALLAPVTAHCCNSHCL